MSRSAILIATLLAPLAAADAIPVRLDAGASGRRDALVRIPLVLPVAPDDGAVASVRIGGGGELIGQIAPPRLLAPPAAGSGVPVEVHVVVPELAPGAVDATVTIVPAAAGMRRFAWTETPGERIDLAHGDRPVARYACVDFAKGGRDEAMKPYHLLSSPDGKRLVNKGPGGQYTHHRGLYYGWSKASWPGGTCDIWHCTKGAHQAHTGVAASAVGPLFGRHRLTIDWNGTDGKAFAKEEREAAFHALGGGTLVEWTSRLTPVVPPLKLAGDVEHAGFHFRAAVEVEKQSSKETIFLRPDGAGSPGSAVTNTPATPWKAMSFVIDGARYTAAYLVHPDNPKEQAVMSERIYGRFGSFFPYTIEAGRTLDVRYQIWLVDGQAKPEDIAARHRDFAEPVRAERR